LPGITALTGPHELFSVVARSIVKWLLISGLPLAFCRSAADLLRETVGVVLRSALVSDGVTSGRGDRPVIRAGHVRNSQNS
jgi:hypothetical protein